MKISPLTSDVLKNFAQINSNLVINAGNTLKTLNESRSLMSSAKVDENFENEFGIYDLTEFLAAISLIQSPELKFAKDHVIIQNAENAKDKVVYRFSDPTILTSATKEVNMPESELVFNITAEEIQKIIRAASVLKHSTLQIVPNKDTIELIVLDKETSISNTYNLNIDSNHVVKNFDKKFEYNFLLTNIKLLLPGDYEVQISSKFVSQWTNQNRSIKYWIALEKSSKIN